MVPETPGGEELETPQFQVQARHWLKKLRLEICHRILTAKLRSVITLQFVITFIIINDKILIAFSFFKDFAVNSGYGRFLKKFTRLIEINLEIKNLTFNQIKF